MKKYIRFSFFVLILLSACKPENEAPLQYISVPTEANSSEPNLLKTKDGTIYLSWIDTDSLKMSKLLVSELSETHLWLPSKEIAKGSNWFVNWADFPSLSSFGDSDFVAHYLEKSAEDTYAYDVKLTISNDKGNTWSSAFSPHKDNTNTEHGFVSKLALNNDTFLAVWLDGRQFAYAETDTTLQKQMSLRSAIIDRNGKFISESLIDNRVCDCCQTDLTMTNDGPMVVYRDRSGSEIRDSYFSLFKNGTWTTPKTVYNDNWIIAGCPVNGPSISSNKNSTVVSWFTMEDGMSKIKVAFYDDATQAFAEPILVDFIDPLGRLDIETIDNNSALVSWVDSVNNKTNIQLQRVYKDGRKSSVFTASATSPKRSSGFPRMISKDDYVYIAWTDSNNGKLNVKTVKISLNTIQ